MTSPFDPADIPAVPLASMVAAIGAMVRCGRSRVLFNAVTRADRDCIETQFWAGFEGPTATGVATLLRFWALIDALKSRRLAARLMDKGFALLGPAGAAAASLRLNADWGFAPQRLIWALEQAKAAPTEIPRIVRLPVPSPVVEPVIELAA